MTKSNFQVRFRELLSSSGTELADIHRATGISAQTLRGWIKDSDRTPQTDTLSKIAAFFGVTPESMTEPAADNAASTPATVARITALESRLASAEARIASLESELRNLLRR